MVVRRPTAPRKKRLQASSGALGSAGSPRLVPKDEDRDAGFDAHEAARELLAEFETAIRNSPSGDTSEGQALTEHFAAALRDVAANGDFSAVPDKTSWHDAVAELQQSGSLEPGESHDLLQQLDVALAPLEKRETKVALEFSRRMQSDGQDNALAWLKEQHQSSKEEATSDSGQQYASDSRPAQISGEEVTKSRSRRLRGPPRQK